MLRKERLAFINVYKIFAAIVIGCYLHYEVFLLTPLNETFKGTDRISLFLMSGTSNYLVELFFLMSGLPFACSYRAKIESGALEFSTFVDKRLCRLLPLSVLTTLVMFPLRVLYEHLYGYFFSGYADLNSLIGSVFLTDSTLLKCRVNPPAWQISKLIVCYILGFVLCRYHKKLGIITFFLPIMLGLVVQEFDMEYPLLEFHISRAYIAFFAGVLMEKVLMIFQSLKISSWCICLGGGILTAVPLFLRGLVSDWSSVSTLFIFTGMIIIGYFSKVINWLGQTKLFVLLADISYDLYLWNAPILILILLLHQRIGITVNTYPFLFALIFIHILVGFVSSIIRKRAYRIVSEIVNIA